MPIYVPGKVTLRQTWQPMDTDAAAYITAVETADGQALEERTKIAIDNFVLGCKADGIWSAIKASCILAGARTLSGALVPLVGTAPTRFGTEGGWNYNRKTGLRGNGTDNYLNSGRANNADPQNNNHNAYYASSLTTGTPSKQIIGDSLGIGANTIRTATNNTLYFIQNRTGTGISTGVSVTGTEGVAAVSRSSSASIDFRILKNTTNYLMASQVPSSSNILLFSSGTTYSDARFAFYSIGESLNLTALDARVTDLINAFGVAIP